MKSRVSRRGENDSFESVDLDVEEEKNQVNLEDLLESSQRKLLVENENLDVDFKSSINAQKRISSVRPYSQVHSMIQVQYGNPNVPEGEEEEVEEEF